MGAIEAALYENPEPYGECDTLARTILRHPRTRMLMRDCYRLDGRTYWIVGGRVCTREQAERLHDERRREGRLTR
ncbi:MAG TPA: hypothetical protein VFS39_03835 [Nitrospira sp.]|nr:hypothetical protein [Nitrospira sp.]